MKKLNMQSLDVFGSNVEKIAHLFPNCVTERLNKEGNPELAIDFEKLQAELSNDIIAEGEERYQFTWPDKRAAVRLANTPTTMTLRPCREESVDFDNTQNLYIEGDNLDVLKVLRETYLGKVKMIYIDPPYNTGHDFVYNDDFVESYKDFAKSCKAYDEDGNLQFSPKENGESNGRFHTDWLNMIYPRLKVARDLLTEDGFIFISIDDNEIENLIKIADEVFGRGNRLSVLIWKKKYTGGKGTSTFADYHEYILAYSKNITLAGDISMARPDEEKGKFTQEDEFVKERGKYYTRPLKSNLDPRPTLVYPIDLPDGKSVTTQWICAKDTYFQLLKEGRIEFKDSSSSKFPVYKKFYENDGGGNVKIPSFIEISNNNEAKEELKSLFKISQTRDLPFQTPKPVKLLELFIKNLTDRNDIVLDFFSGSASTAHAVFESNISNQKRKRRFIMVQLPETTDEKSEAYKAGYKNICEIGKERIRRAGKKVKEEAGLIGHDLDIGFRVLKLDSSNMTDVYYTPQESEQRTLFDENVKPDRSNEDLLFQVMLDLGIELSAKIEAKQIAGKTVHFVDGNYLVACFDCEINESTIKKIAKQQPVYFVMRDASAVTDSVIDNFEQIFKHYSPDTNCRIL